MSDELTIKKDRVLSAASKCPTAKAALEELFPEAFGEKWEDITASIRIIFDRGELKIVDPKGNWVLWYLSNEGMVSAPNIEKDTYWKIEGKRVFRRIPC